MATSTDGGPAARFVTAFAKGWSAPTPNAWDGVLTDDVTLHQPLLPPVHGRAAQHLEYARLLELLPDLTGHVTSWATTHDQRTVFLSVQLTGTLGGRPLHIDLVDRCELDTQGRCTARTAYLDPLPLVAALVRRPAAWPRWWRSGVGPIHVRRRWQSQPGRSRDREPPATGDKLLIALAALRAVGFGAPAWIAPAFAGRALGLGGAARQPAARYLMRLYGVRATALGLSYLLAEPAGRVRATRLALLVDSADTVMTPWCRLPRRAAWSSLALTSTYAAVEAWHLSQEGRR